MGHSLHRTVVPDLGSAEQRGVHRNALLIPEALPLLTLATGPGESVIRGNAVPADPDWQADDFIDALTRKLIEKVANGEQLESHCHRLALMASLLGVQLGLSPSDMLSLRRGAYLHDIGKIGIPPAILLKRGPLDKREWRIMKKHPAIGEHICRDLPSLRDVLPIIRSHHERWDGTGYPDGLRGEEIPLLARITQIADIYDALTTERPYKCAFAPEKALEIIQEEGERGWRDPSLVQCIQNLFPVFKTLPPENASSFSLQSLAEVVKQRKWS